MYPLDTLLALNERAAARIPAAPAWARDCSFLSTRQGRTFILHSASLRSTLVYSADSTRETFRGDFVKSHPFKANREVFHALLYWLPALGQAGLNALIENLARGASLEAAESAACLADRPEWSFRRVQYQHGGGDILAFRQPWPGAVERQTAKVWRWIHARTSDK